jgi:membrane protein required for colicin V production
MQVYDFVMLGVLGAAVLFGAWKGLAWQVASLAAIFVSYLVALRFRGPVAALITVDPPWDGFIAMFIIYLVCSLAIWIAFGFVRSFIDRFHLKSFDRQAGAFVGALKGATLCIVITLFAVTLLGQTKRQQICQSKSGRFIAQTIDQLKVLAPKEIHAVLEPYLKKLDAAMAESGSAPAASPTPGGPLNNQSPAGSFAEQWREELDRVREITGQLIPTGREATGQQFQGTIQGYGTSSAANNVAWPYAPPPQRDP